MNQLRHISLTLLLLATTLQASAQSLTDRYTSQRPLVIVCDKKNPPYEFVNDHGKPGGINIDIVNAVVKELKLPCAFIVKDWTGAKNSFESGEADIIMADGRYYKDSPYFISENTISYQRVSIDSVAEIHFIGKDRQLIEQIDDQYSRMKQHGDIANIRNRWLYPEQATNEEEYTILFITIAALLLAVVFYLLTWLVKRHVARVTRQSSQINQMMQKVLHMGNFDVMLYDIENDRITNQYGSILPKDGLTLEEYTRRIHTNQREEFIRKSRSLHEGRERHFELNKLWNQGTDEEPRYLNFQGHAICERDDHGHPAYVINAVSDVTHDVEEIHIAHDIMHKYDTILSNPFVAMAFYDRKGNLTDQNQAMKKVTGINTISVQDDAAPNVRFTKNVQPIYNANGDICNYLVTMTEQAANP